MSAPTVSVLLPTWDAEATIERAIKDVLAQSVRSLELLCVDDGLRDATRARLEALALGDPRVQVDGGVSGPGGRAQPRPLRARGPSSRGWTPTTDPPGAAGGELWLRSRPSCRSSAWAPGWRSSATIVPRAPNLKRYAPGSARLYPERLFAERLVESPLCHPSVTLRREALEWAGGWREGDFAEDWDLRLRLLESGRALRCVGRVLYRWRDHERRLTRTDPRYDRERHLDLKARFLSPLLREPVTVWGAGEIGRKLGRRLARLGARVARWVEVNPRQLGQRIDGAPVVAPAELGAPQGHLVAAVGAKGAREEIRTFLEQLGWVEGRDFTCAA